MDLAAPVKEASPDLDDLGPLLDPGERSEVTQPELYQGKVVTAHTSEQRDQCEANTEQHSPDVQIQDIGSKRSGVNIFFIKSR